MYRQFQHDLYRMRLETARNYVGVLQKSLTPISISQTDPVKLHVEVRNNFSCICLLKITCNIAMEIPTLTWPSIL